MSLFKRDIEPMCLYCAHGTELSGQEIACVKKGVQTPSNRCKRFRYDPLKRVPPRPKKADFSGLSEDDFKL